MPEDKSKRGPGRPAPLDAAADRRITGRDSAGCPERQTAQEVEVPGYLR